MSRYLAAYDISVGSRRARVARELAGYGSRLQESVFEVSLEPEEIPTLCQRVGSLLGRYDRFDLVPIDLDERRARLSWQRAAGVSSRVVLL